MRSKEWLDATAATHTAWAVSRLGHVRFAAVQHYHMKNVHTGDDDHIGDAQNAHTGCGKEGCLISNHTTLVHNRHAENTMDGGTLLSDVQDTIVLGRSLAAKRQETTFNSRFAAVQNYHMKNVHTGDDDHIGDAQNAHTGCGKKGCLTNNHLALVHNRNPLPFALVSGCRSLLLWKKTILKQGGCTSYLPGPLLTASKLFPGFGFESSLPFPLVGQFRSFARYSDKTKKKRSMIKKAWVEGVQCVNCSEVFNAPVAMDQHNSIIHSDMEKSPTTNVCPYCRNLYQNQAALQDHKCAV